MQEEALSDAIENLISSIDGYNIKDEKGMVNPCCFEWAKPQDF
jgi:hypothetical protein